MGGESPRLMRRAAPFRGSSFRIRELLTPNFDGSVTVVILILRPLIVATALSVDAGGGRPESRNWSAPRGRGTVSKSTRPAK